MPPSWNPRRKLLWFALALACAGMSGMLGWLDYVSAHRSAESDGWAQGEGQLYEVGIGWSHSGINSNYDMTARYTFRVDGRDYAGHVIAAGYSSKSPAEVRSLIATYAREAAEYSLEDLGTLNPQRTWSVAYRAVPVRYDPRDPAHSQMVLDKPIAAATIGGWLVRGLAVVFSLAAAISLVAAWRMARKRRNARAPESGSAS